MQTAELPASPASCYARGMEEVNLAHKLSLFDECWSPRIVGEVNDVQVKLAKLQGEFVWHRHEAEDETPLGIRDRGSGIRQNAECKMQNAECKTAPGGTG
ncbi:MAG: hypothetical protein EHM24_08190 [Acidobacteria bacterium]|nr:MAG: hypothetical protein EHM24_08190 [Acidobacteriota bacterium]